MQAHYLACLIEHACPSCDADLNVHFTNTTATTMSMCITAVTRAAQGVELMNRDPDVSENQVWAHYFCSNALDDIAKCLDCKTSDNEMQWITSSHCNDTGITLLMNLTHMTQTIMDIHQAITGYRAQNPADYLFLVLTFIIACGVI
jgi:hypothetical protein